MTEPTKMQKITTIVNHVRDKIERENKALCEKGRHSEQKPFDYDGAILSLIFVEDCELDKAYAMVIGN
ncbi:hypothetical protein VmeM32_00077 [Vibrio phage vB_VmeM-32]|nr:hypothetical protein VmeM32_00077 [Vibrio phage vB_VmeM-32]